MMAMLHEECSVFLQGSSFPVRKDTFSCLLMLEMLEDPLLTDYQKSALLIKLFYKKRVPLRLQEAALTECFAYLKAAASPSEPEHSDSSASLFSITKDFPLICASFLQVYGLHPLRQNLNWHEFLSLLRCLPADAPLCRIILQRQACPSLPQQDRELLEYLRTLSE